MGVPSRSRKTRWQCSSSRQVFLPTPRRRHNPAGEARSRSATVATLARSRALAARVPRRRSTIGVSRRGLVPGIVQSAAVVIRACSGWLDPGKDVPPGPQHLFGVVEPLGDVAAQGLGEEFGERLAQGRWIEQLGVDRDLGVGAQVRRVGRAVTPLGQRTGGQFVQRDRGSVSFGVQIPPRGLAERQQRVEITGRSGADVVGRRPGEREVEQDQVELLSASDHAHGDVVRLDVAMGDALFFEMVDHAQQVFAEALQQVDVQPAFFAQPMAKCLDQAFIAVGEHGTHQEAEVLADLHRPDQIDDARVPQLVLAQQIGFVLQPRVVFGIVGGFQDVILAVSLHQQRHGTGPLADATHDGVSIGQPIAELGP